MQFNLIIAGVGGQGILTIAQLITQAALRRGYDVRQSEVHGMSQRGGAVQAHVRFADHPLHSELIPLGEADLILAVEPLEALRYVQYLKPGGAIVASSVPVANIADYPSIEGVVDRIRRAARHVIVDAAKLARDAGSARAENVAILGAASIHLPFDHAELDELICGFFADKGQKIVEQNRRAFELGRAAAMNQLLEIPADRDLLFEHEVYGILRDLGGIQPPAHVFVPSTRQIEPRDIDSIPTDKIVVKIVSRAVVHKSDQRGVVIVPRTLQEVRTAAGEMLTRVDPSAEGILLVELVEHPRELGGELFVGIRNTRDFGLVLAAGIGGTDTELLAERLRKHTAIALAPVPETSAQAFFKIFSKTLAYELISGQARGRERRIDDERLIHCFNAFMEIARRFRVKPRGLVELEVNPFAIREGRLVPLDGRARLGNVPPAATPRPLEAVQRMLEPRSISIVGVSARRANFGRIILSNILECGFPKDRLHVVKDDADHIDGVRCVPSIASLPEPVDLLVAATGAQQVPQIVQEVLGGSKCSSVILISGAVGEKEGTESLHESLRAMIGRARSQSTDGPVFLGANCMGLRSVPGRYDTFFIPKEKRDPARRGASHRLAIISQSGAFIITRISKLQHLDPSICVSLGNQVDLTVSDFVRVIGQRDDIDCIGVYVEGFAEMDGLEFVRAVREVSQRGKTIVLYKAGRSEKGRAATRGHTASLAGDWDVCVSAATHAGALVARNFGDFEMLLELGTRLHTKTIGGNRIAAISNAGFETVGMADAVRGKGYEAQMPAPSEQTRRKLDQILSDQELSRLVNTRNPLDLTPMASDEAYEQAIRAMLDAEEYDAVVVGIVPMTPQLLTTPEQITQSESIARRVIQLFRDSYKPLVVVVDSSGMYDALAGTMRAAGVPVFRSADLAVAVLGRYLCHRTSAS